MAVALTFAIGLSSIPAHAVQVNSPTLRIAKYGPSTRDNAITLGEMRWLWYSIDGLALGKDGKNKVQAFATVYAINGETEIKIQNRTAVFGRHEAPFIKKGVISTVLPVQGKPDWRRGKYRIKLEVKDLVSGESDWLKFDFTLEDQKFGLINPRLTVDLAGKYDIAWRVQQGTPAVLFADISGIQVSNDNDVDFTVDVTAMNKFGKELGKERVVAYKKKVKNAKEWPSIFPTKIHLLFNEIGEVKYKLELKDNISGKKSSLTMPIKVDR